MKKRQEGFETLLNEKVTENILPRTFTTTTARKLLSRISNLKLYAQSYAFTLHFRYTNFDVKDILAFASKQGLGGIEIHIDYGGKHSIMKKKQSELKEIKEQAEKLGLDIMLDVSSTKKRDIDRVVNIAKRLNVRNIRVYNRHGGKLDECIQNCITDLHYACQKAEEYDLHFAIESHEAMKSHELARIVKEINSPRLGIVFDFANMINADEGILSALKEMSPYIRWAHVKDVTIKRDGQGNAQQGVRDGTGDLPQLRMIYDLLLLGTKKPQVPIFSLQQVNGYNSPAYRFNDEGNNPRIPARNPSFTEDTPDLTYEQQLRIEKNNATHQVRHTRKLLGQLREMAERRLEQD